MINVQICEQWCGFLKIFDKNLLDYTAACCLAYPAPGLSGADCGKIVPAVSLGWCGGRTTVWPNCLLSLLTVYTNAICQHLVSPLHYIHTTFIQFYTVLRHSLLSPEKHRVCYSCLMYSSDKYYWGCWPERIKYSQTISSPPQSSSVCDCVGRYMWRMHCEPFNTNSA